MDAAAEQIWVRILRAAPFEAYGALVSMLSRLHVPLSFRPAIWGIAAKIFGMNLAEAELPARRYATFQDLFCRRLKAGARTVDSDDLSIVSPVDGVVSAVGVASGGQLLQAKGKQYTLGELLDDEELARSLDGGCYVVFYLRPKDYHRIHAPMAARLLGCRRLPGKTLPVRPCFVRQQEKLFVGNRRVILEFSSESGKMAAVFVGAAAVASITTPFGTEKEALICFDPPQLISRADEIGAFRLGSTVIVVFEKRVVDEVLVGLGDEVRVGKLIARQAPDLSVCE